MSLYNTIHYFLVLHTIFSLLGGQKMDLFPPQGAIRYTSGMTVGTPEFQFIENRQILDLFAWTESRKEYSSKDCTTSCGKVTCHSAIVRSCDRMDRRRHC